VRRIAPLGGDGNDRMPTGPARSAYTRVNAREREAMVAYSPGPEWIVVLVVLVLLFGAKKLPELARSVGRSTSEFKKGMTEGAAETDEAGNSEPGDTAEKDKAENRTQTE